MNDTHDSVIPRLRERMASIEKEQSHMATAVERVEARVVRLVETDLPDLRREIAQYRADHSTEWARLRGAVYALGVIWTVAIAIATVIMRTR